MLASYDTSCTQGRPTWALGERLMCSCNVTQRQIICLQPNTHCPPCPTKHALRRLQVQHMIARQSASKNGLPAPAFQFDAVRTLRLMFYAGVVGTPLIHYWYNFLEAVRVPQGQHTVTTQPGANDSGLFANSSCHVPRSCSCSAQPDSSADFCVRLKGDASRAAEMELGITGRVLFVTWQLKRPA
jgi:hypothetical protein